MRYKVGISKTSTGNTQVQVIYYHKRKTIVVKHIGSSDDKNELVDLKKKAEEWILEQSNSYGLFSKTEVNKFEDTYEYQGVYFNYAYEFLEKIFLKFKFNNHLTELFKDLMITRILEPGSKKNNLEFLQEFLNKFHSENQLYKSIAKYDDTMREGLEKEVVNIAKSEFGFDFSFVLYDVTTLYFESFKDDEFKRVGFSKDNKSNQPQVVIGLIVTKDGFPVSYQVFKGNTFEGNTFLPIIKAFQTLHNITTLTIVADSAMLSKINLEALVQANFNYIVGARLANLKQVTLDKIEKEIEKVDKNSIRLDNLIVDYSSKRFLKDKKDLDKQVEKAKKNLAIETFRNPRIKFLKTENLKSYLNQSLIDKHIKLCGLKGYATNLTLSNSEIIKYYHNLYKVEHAWRIAKSDLEARPIYHHKESSIKNHLLICFGALAISVYLEIKNKTSIAQVVHSLKRVTDAKVFNKLNEQTFFQRVKLGESVKKLEKLSYE